MSNSNINSTRFSLTNKPKRIISVSRRTDIPAFYTPWFFNRLDDGYVGVVNPYNRKPSLVSLKPEDITCIVFWSKDYRPLLERLSEIQKRLIPFYCHFTITGHSTLFESNGPPTSESIDTAIRLSRQTSPQQVIWRFDPIILSDKSGVDDHISRFTAIASKLKGNVTQCITSFITPYQKVLRHLAAAESQHRIRFTPEHLSSRNALISKLTAIASSNGMTLQTCCAPALQHHSSHAAQCIDPKLIERLKGSPLPRLTNKPMRSGCGCIQSTDIGTYNTCPHGCIYCYANTQKTSALKNQRKHDPESPFLGYTKSRSDLWIQSLQRQTQQVQTQLQL